MRYTLCVIRYALCVIRYALYVMGKSNTDTLYVIRYRKSRIQIIETKRQIDKTSNWLDAG